ncbi:MAG: hypothetical protein LBB61_04050 [Treponema sp.]|jgi:hypothetical protein|nr:hypothetical protein [Treponema sp.]
MRVSKVLLFSTVLLVLFIGNVAAQYSRTGLQNMYMSYLTAEGYAPSIDSDGDVAFKKEGRPFWIEVNEDDLEYFRIGYLANYALDYEYEVLQFPVAINHATKVTKVAKVYSLDDRGRFMISAEIYLVRPEDFKIVFNRMISAINRARENFLLKMEE